MALHRRDFIKAAAFAAALSSLPFGVRAEGADKMKIGIIGSGKVGSALGRVWVQRGHEVMFASRTLAHDKALAKELGANARAGTPLEAAKFGEVILFAVPYRALPELGKNLGEALDGKIVIDACNPYPGRDGEIAIQAREIGVGLMSAKLLPGARVVRAFNAISATRMGSAHEEPGKIGMPVAGDDTEAVQVASRLIREIGYEPVFIGGLEMGRYLMPGTPLAGERSPDEIKRIANTF